MATTKRAVYPEEALFQTTAFPQYVRNAGTNFPVTGLAFDAAGTETAYFKFMLQGYGSGNITAKLGWYADTASSGDVRWQVALACITPDTDTQDVETKAFATAHAFTDSHLGTTAQRVMEASQAISNLDSAAEGDLVYIKIDRLGGDGADTMTGDAILLYVKLEYSDT